MESATSEGKKRIKFYAVCVNETEAGFRSGRGRSLPSTMKGCSIEPAPEKGQRRQIRRRHMVRRRFEINENSIEMNFAVHGSR